MTTASAPTSGPVKRLLTIFRGPTLLLAVGLGLSAVAGSGFTAIVNHTVPGRMTAGEIAPLTGLYLLLNAIGTGMFAGFEQEMTRAVSRALALGQPERVVIRHQVRNAAWVAGGTALVVCAASPFVVHKWMDGDWTLLFELLLGLFGTWAAFLVRGVLSGRRQFSSYAITMVVEGLGRLLPVIVLVVIGLDSTWGFGFVFSFGFVIAAVSALVVKRAPITDGVAPPEDADGEPESANQAARRLARLTGGIMAGQVLVYAVPLYINGELSTDHKLVISVTAAIGLTRLALLVLFPLQAPLLPKLSAAAARREMGAVRRATAGLVGACLAAGLFGLLVTVVVGPWIVRVIMGAQAPLTRVFLGELAVGTLFMLVANVLQTALTALNRQQTVLAGWVAGVVVMGLMLLVLPFGVLTTAAVAAMAGPAVTMLVMGFDVLRETRSTVSVGAAAAPAPATDADAEIVR